MLLALILAAAVVAAPYRAPRTPDGRPDLQGEWTNASYTSLQRGRNFKALHATEAEAAAYIAKQRLRQQGQGLEPEEEMSPDGVIGSAQSEWSDEVDGLMRIDGRLRTSLIVDPADGRLPYNTLGRRMVQDSLTRDESAMDGPEDRLSDERCMMALSGAAGPPMLPTSQNGHYRIVQTPGVIAIESEMIHDVRLVRMGGRHDGVADAWLGDSIGRWEGDTLVVETVRQHPLTAQRFIPSGILIITPGAKLTERFTRVSATELRYDFEVEDPAVYTRPWRAEALFRATSAPMFEYACHEGNYALRNILAGARAKEAEAKAVEAAKAPAQAPAAVAAKAAP